MIEPYLPAFELSNSLSFAIDTLTPSTRKFIHYTGLPGFYGIAESARLRFTSARSTNDPSEFLFGQQVVEKALAEIVSELSGADKEAVRGCAQEITIRNFKPFVFCMSEVADEDEESVGDSPVPGLAVRATSVTFPPG